MSYFNLIESDVKMATLYYIVLDSSSGVRRTALLQHVSVTGLIHDAVAEYTLVQTYVNPLKNAAIETSYTFPLYEGVAVSGFEAEVDGRRIVGRVQEKETAKKEYDEAVKSGKVVSLLEQERPDVFQASVGNIPPSKTISIRITLVAEIKHNAGENQVRFVLPTAIAPRYGSYDVPQMIGASPGPGPFYQAQGASTNSKLSVNMSCAMSKPITSIQSPSHTIEVHLGTSSTEAEAASAISFDPNRARVSLTTESLLDRDLVFIIQSLGLDEPRALVERHPKDGTHAISLSFSPRFALTPLRTSELIFLVDRSGSMGGTQIQIAGQALELFLRSIPFDDHYLNVVGFGSTHKALFPKSREYNAESLKTSTQYAQALRADMGGTEMTSAFREVFQLRRHEVPTQIFLLTDGEIWDVDTLVGCIREAVEEGERSNSHVRVFSLGVGSSVSHHLIESVARAGGGYAQLVMEGERMEKKVVNMLKSALMPPVTNVAVQWAEMDSDELVEESEEDFVMVEGGGSSEAVDLKESNSNMAPINLFSTSPEVASPSPAPSTPLSEIIVPVQQAPFKIPSLFRGARFTIYAILSSTTPMPKELVLRGSSPDGPVELRVNVELVEGEAMLHCLAARTLVRDLEEGSSCIHALGRSTTDTNKQMLRRLGVHVLKDGKKCKTVPLSSNHVISKITKERILDIALRYNLSTKYTSWVAIDEESQERIMSEKYTSSHIPAGGAMFSAPPLVAMAQSQAMGKNQQPRQYAAFATSLTPAFGANSTPSYSSGAVSWGPFGAASTNCYFQAALSPFGGALAPQAQQHMFFQPQAQQHMAQPQQGQGQVSFGVAPPPRGQLTVRNQLHVQQQQQLVQAFQFGREEAELQLKSEDAASFSDPHAQLRSILQHQHYDGLFSLIPGIATLFSTSVEDLRRKLRELCKQCASKLSKSEWETIWATCLAVEFMRKKLPDLHDEWELVVDKAEKRVEALLKNAKDVATMEDAAELLEVISNYSSRG